MNDDDDITATDLPIGADEKRLGVVSAIEIVCGDATIVVIKADDTQYSGTHVGIWTPHPRFTGPHHLPPEKRRERAAERAMRHLIEYRNGQAQPLKVERMRRISVGEPA